MKNSLLIHCTYGKDDPERAILPFIVGNVAVTADQPATIFLTIEGVRLATKGYADGITKEGFTPLKEIMQSFVENSGGISACGASTKQRGITDADLIESTQIDTTAKTH